MTLAISNIKKVKDGKTFELTATVALSGSYPALGEPLDLSGYNPFVSTRQPDIVNAVGKAGFQYQYDHANKKLMVRVNDAGGVNAPMGEHTAAAYAAGVSGDTIIIRATWLSYEGS